MIPGSSLSSLRRAGPLVLLFALMPGASPLEAHNGRVATARAVSGIVVDGDFSDWPADAEAYRIELVEYGDELTREDDLEAHFHVGYSPVEMALYLAVEVRDESLVMDGTSRWNTQDGCAVFLHPDHPADRRTVLQYNICGQHPAVESAGNPRGRAVTWSTRRESGVYRYEWRFGLEELVGAPIRSGRVLGLDIAIYDKDDDTTYSWVAWGRGVRKVVSGGRVGDVLLLDESPRPGIIAGRVLDAETGQLLAFRNVLLRSGSTELVVETDSSGEFSVEVLPGAYEASAGPRWESAGRVRFTVREGTQTPVVLRRSGMSPRSRKLGPGVTTPAGPGVSRGVLRFLDASDGFTCEGSSQIIQDTHGVLWVATSTGLMRYDGRSVTVLTRKDGLLDDWIESLLEDRRGRLWIGTSEGLSVLEGDTITHVRPPRELSASSICFLLEDHREGIWVASNTWLFRMNGDVLRPVVKLRTGWVHALAEGPEGVLWVGTPLGLFRYGGDELRRVSVGDTAAGNYIEALLVDTAGRLLIGTRGGLHIRDADRPLPWPVETGLCAAPVTALAEGPDGTGNVYVGTSTEGVLCLHDGQVRPVSRFRDSTMPGAVESLLLDRDDLLWIGSRHGLSLYSGLHFRNFTVPDGLPARDVTALTKSRGTMYWFGTSAGLLEYDDDGKGFRTFGKEEGLLHERIECLLYRKNGQLWIGSSAGIRVLEGGQIRPTSSRWELPSKQVLTLLEDSRDRVWAGTVQGACCLAGPRQFVLNTQDGLPSDVVGSLLEDSDGRIWMGTAAGLSCFDGSRVVPFPQERALRGLPSYCLLEDSKRRLWVGTSAGVFCLEEGKMTRYGRADGLPTSSVSCLAEDGRGHLWLGTPVGVARFDGRAFQTFLPRDGLGGTAVHDLLVADPGVMWVATDAGLTRYEYRQSRPGIVLTGVHTDRRLGPVQELSMPTSQQLVTFEFHGLSHKTFPGGMLYCYRLTPLEKDWKFTRSEQVEYEALPRGSHVFEVQAIDRDLDYSEGVARVRVDVHLPWQILVQTALGALVCVLLAALIRGWIRRTRRVRQWNAILEERVETRTRELQHANEDLQREMEVRRAAEREREKLRGHLLESQKLEAVGTLAAGVAHDFSNVITSICGCVEAARPEVSPGSKPAICLDQIHAAATQASRISRELLTFARKSHAEKTSENLGELVRKSLNMLRHAVPSSIEVVPRIEDPERLWIRANPTQIQQVLLNLALNARDAMPEGGCLGIRVSPSVQEGCVLLEVQDSGEGISGDVQQHVFEPFYSTKPREEGTGMGMAVVHGIVTDHGGAIELESAEGEGTTVRIRLPLQDAPSSGCAGPVETPVPRFRGEERSVIIGEGSSQVRAILASLLSATGLHVVQAAEEDELMRALEAHSQGDPVVVFDANLCSGGPGAFLDELRRVQPDVRVVVVVGDPALDLQDIESEHVIIMKKPFPASALISAVERLLGISSREATKTVADGP